MSYNSDTGIISAPVSIDDVKQALGESSNDLATLCKSSNINIFSKHKPIRYNSNFLDNPIRENKDYTNTSVYLKLPCIVRCGMNIPIDTFKNWKASYGDNFLSTIGNNTYHDNIFGQSGLNPSDKTYVKDQNLPLGGADSPYRLGDFRDYDHKASTEFFSTNMPQFYSIEHVYADTYPSLEVILYKPASLSIYNVTLEDILPDIASNWSFWIQTQYTSHTNTSEKVITNRFVANCKSPDDNIYASNTIAMSDIKHQDSVTVSPFLAETRGNYLYDTTRIIPIKLPGSIVFSYYPRIAQVDYIKSGSSGFGSTTTLVGGTLIAQVRVYKLPSATLTITNGMFRSICSYAGKTTYGTGYVCNSSGTHITSTTIPKGANTEYTTIYISFENMYDGSYSGTDANVTYEWKPTGTWTTCYGGGGYKLS